MKEDFSNPVSGEGLIISTTTTTKWNFEAKTVHLSLGVTE